MLPLLLSAVLITAPAAVPGNPYAEDDEWNAPEEEDDEEGGPRVRITAWGGDALGEAGTGRSSSFFGGEAGWAFDSMDVGVYGAGYRKLADSDREWTPVVLARFTQRFKLRHGPEAAFGFGLGAGRPKGWRAWYQIALGVRVPLGPLFLAGELAFEQYDLLRLGGGLGVAFW